MSKVMIPDRIGNIVIAKDLDNKETCINLDRVDYWKGDSDHSTEVHLFNCNFSIWIQIDETEFRKYYFKYKKELK